MAGASARDRAEVAAGKGSARDRREAGRGKRKPKIKKRKRHKRGRKTASRRMY